MTVLCLLELCMSIGQLHRREIAVVVGMGGILSPDKNISAPVS